MQFPSTQSGLGCKVESSKAQLSLMQTEVPSTAAPSRDCRTIGVLTSASLTMQSERVSPRLERHSSRASLAHLKRAREIRRLLSSIISMFIYVPFFLSDQFSQRNHSRKKTMNSSTFTIGMQPSSFPQRIAKIAVVCGEVLERKDLRFCANMDAANWFSAREAGEGGPLVPEMPISGNPLDVQLKGILLWASRNGVDVVQQPKNNIEMISLCQSMSPMSVTRHFSL